MNTKTGGIPSVIFLCYLTISSALGQNCRSGKLFQGYGATLYYEIRGPKTGTPLLVISGGPGVDHSYMHFTLHSSSALEELAKDRPVTFYDQRGVAKSPALKAGQSCTVADQVDDVEALRAYLGYEHINLLGHSFGGYLAMAYAARYPERIERLILCDSGPPKASDNSDLFGKVFPELKERMKAIAIKDEATKKAALMCYVSGWFCSPKNRDAFLAKFSTLGTPIDMGESLRNDLETLDFTPALPKFRFPTLVMTGRFDVNAAPSDAYRIHKSISGSKFVVFEHSGHLPFYEEQGSFVRTVRGFLSGK